MECISVNEEIFKEKYREYYEKQPSKRPYKSAQLKEIAEEIVKALDKKATTKTCREYYLIKKYDIVTIEDKTYVVKKSSTANKIIYLTPEEEIFKKLIDVYINCGHGSRDKMMAVIKQNSSIPRPCVEIFLQCCQTCQLKKSKTVAKVVVKPILTKSFMTRGQVDLVDFQTIADGDYKWLLNYQDHATKFLCLRPLKAKQATAVADELLKIFLQFGVPSILQSDNGREFVNKVIKELKVSWPQLHIVHGRPRHRQSQGSVERANQDVENMLRAWMVDNKSTSWAIGCYFVQWQKNNSLHRVIGRSPYKAVFGSDPKVGLASSNLPQHMLSSLVDEEDLEKLRIVSNSSAAVPESSDINNNTRVNESINSTEAVTTETEAETIETPEMCVTCQEHLSDGQNGQCQICSMPIHLSCI